MLPAVVFGNTGNMGLAVCQFALGPAAMPFATTVFVVHLIAQGLCAGWMCGRKKRFWKLLLNPALAATVLGILGYIWRIVPPSPVLHIISFLGILCVPLMLVSLGYTLGGIDLSNVSRDWPFVAYRFLFGTGAAIVMAMIFDLDRLSAGVLILQLSMPIAVSTYILVRNEHSRERLGSVIASSHLAALITVPLILAIFRLAGLSPAYGFN